MQYFWVHKHYKTVCITLIFRLRCACNTICIQFIPRLKNKCLKVRKYTMIKEEFYTERLQENLNKFIATKDIKYYNNLKEINKVCCGINRCTNNTLYDFYNLYLVTKGI